MSGILDREISDSHRLTVAAETDSSPALVSYRRLAVRVTDSNDNAPRFDSEQYGASVSEVAEVRTKVLRVRASDPDSGSSGEVRYRISSEEREGEVPFAVGERDGWISTKRPLDREGPLAAPFYEFEVTAEDGGGLSASVRVTVAVEDANDSPAVFSQRHYSAAVNEMALPGTIIFQLALEDEDPEAGRRSGADTELYIVGGDPRGQFQVSVLLLLYNQKKEQSFVSSGSWEKKPLTSQPQWKVKAVKGDINLWYSFLPPFLSLL